MFKNSNVNQWNKHQVTVKSLFWCIALNAAHPNQNLESQKHFFSYTELRFSAFVCSIVCFILFSSVFPAFFPSLGSDRGKENRINLVWLKSSFPLLPLVAHTDITCPARRAGDTQRERERDTGEGRRAGK